jgi:hypothetical protein
MNDSSKPPLTFAQIQQIVRAQPAEDFPTVRLFRTEQKDKSTTKQIVRSLLTEAKQELAALRGDEATLFDTRALILRRGWRLGKILSKLKAQIPRGQWQTWICMNLPERGDSERARLDNARRCITLVRRAASSEAYGPTSSIIRPSVPSNS